MFGVCLLDEFKRHFRTHPPWENFPAVNVNRCEWILRRKNMFVATQNARRWTDKFLKCLDRYKVIFTFKKEIFLESFDPSASVDERRYLIIIIDFMLLHLLGK